MKSLSPTIAAMVAGTFATLPSLAAQWGPVDVNGFVLDEFSRCGNCALHQRNPSSYDPRGVLPATSPSLPVNQPGDTTGDKENLFLFMLSAGTSHEFDNAVSLEARLTTRQRNYHADIYGQQLDEAFVGASHPLWGSVKYGTQFTRSWSRADAFSYPYGLSNPWSEAGAGYGLVRHALRIATPEFEPAAGKIRFEVTFAAPHREYPLNNVSPVYAPPPSPRLAEVFVQFSNQRNLVEFVAQHSSGGRQSSFAEGAFVGAQGNTDQLAAANGYRDPSETVFILQGNYWHDEHWKFTYGLMRNWWSGQQQQCDYSTGISNCYYDQGGFNYATDNRLHSATEYDAMLGLSYVQDALWTYTLGGVRLNKAYVSTPTEWGQSNTATFVNLGAYRKIPNFSSHFDTSVYAGLARVQYGRQGPAPLSMPNNQAFSGVDPRVSRSGNTITIGTKLIF